MIIGTGIDIINVKRIEKSFNRFGNKFVEKIFSKEEAKYCLSKKYPYTCLAARFAVKEAYIKALNIPPGFCFSLKDIYLEGEHFGKKKLISSGNLSILEQKKEVRNIHISISHEREFAIAMVVLEK